MLRFSTTLKSSEITSVAIGGFDGMHRGHQKLVEELDENGVILVIDKGYSNLTPGFDRCRYVKNGCVFVDLDDIKELSDEEFINFLRVNFPNLKRVIVGYDFKFGKNRQGSLEKLKKEFDLKVVDEVKIDGISVHSQVIRELLKDAKIKEANKLLGRAYNITGKTKKGQGLGKKELVATINLADCDFLLPKNGVYATKTIIENREFLSATFIGKRDSTDGEFAVETHLLNTKIDFLPKEIEIKFFDFVRDNKKFDTLLELKEQIKSDIFHIKKFLSS